MESKYLYALQEIDKTCTDEPKYFDFVVDLQSVFSIEEIVLILRSAVKTKLVVKPQPKAKRKGLAQPGPGRAERK